MKPVLATLALLSIVTFSCKKSEDNTSTNPPAGGGGTTTTERSWRVGGSSGTVYKVNNYTRSSETYSAYDTAGNSINFTFESYPPVTGSYKVIDDKATFGAKQVKVYVGKSGSSANTYVATGSNGVSADITVVTSNLGTQLKIVMPETWAVKLGGTDSVLIAATLSPL
jgi:hypothetical protein